MRRLVAVFAIAMIAAGCRGSTTYDVPTGAGQPILVTELKGGLFRPGELLSRPPMVALYGDGTVLWSNGPFDISTAHLTAKEIQTVVAAADRGGLLGPDANSPTCAGSYDSGTYVYHTTVAGKTHTISVYQPSCEDPSMSPEIIALRRRLSAFHIPMSNEDLGRKLEWTPYDYSYAFVFADPLTGDEVTASERALTWPLAADPGYGESVDYDLKCLRLSKHDMDELAHAGDVSSGKLWTALGGTYRLWARAAFPDEPGCQWRY